MSTWTDPDLINIQIKSLHITEMRDLLDDIDSNACWAHNSSILSGYNTGYDSSNHSSYKSTHRNSYYSTYQAYDDSTHNNSAWGNYVITYTYKK